MQVNLGSLQRQLSELQLQTGSERISPTLDAILELLDEAPGDDAAAAADEFVRQVVEASSSGSTGAAATLPMPWSRPADAEGGAGQQPDEAAFDAVAADGDSGAGDAAAAGEQEGEASMEGVVAEYAYAAGPALGDVPAGRQSSLVRAAGMCIWM